MQKVTQPEYHDKIDPEDEDLAGKPKYAWAKSRREQDLLPGLEIFYRDGNVDVLQYHDFICGRFRGDYIKLYFHHCTLFITGLNLKPQIARFANRHRLIYLCERHVDKIELLPKTTECWIEEIDIGPPQVEEIGVKR
jgi:hypothetical protein